MDGIKFDIGKPEWNLVPWEELEDVVKVLQLGAAKYAPDNWKKVPNSKRRYVAAAFRHLIARSLGQLCDEETKLPHTAHAICCLLFLGWHDKNPCVGDVNRKVYISGPISGMPDYNKEAFDKAEKAIRSEGLIPVSPFSLLPISHALLWEDYMKADIKALMDCAYIYPLSGWELSTGAQMEMELAKQLRIKILPPLAEE